VADWIPVYAILAFLFVFAVLNLIETKSLD
jgi:hypothetical protein